MSIIDTDILIPWLFGSIVVIAVAWAPVSCTRSNNDKIEEAIKNGVDPIIARCTYSEQADKATCVLAVSAAKRSTP